jgi:hypothetical protein
MKYIVGENTSFIANGRVYKPGEEIDSSVFKHEETIKVALSAGKLKPVDDTPEGDTGGGDTGDTSIAPKKRRAMEKAAVDNSLGNPEEIKNLSDKDLADLLTAAGVVA